MSSKMNIRTGDTVMVITGDNMKDVGKTGKVLKVYPSAQAMFDDKNVDAVVIACDVTDSWLKVVRQTLAPTGVKVTHFSFEEKEI